jgi:1-acyl-sn-glycerol-3-phosphate acyltransferase
MGERAPLLYRVSRAVLLPIVNALYRPWTEGLENIPTFGPAILASNHLSFFDHVFLAAVVDRPIYFLGKSDYFAGWRRFFFERIGVIPVDRTGGEAGEASLHKGEQILRSGRLLAIYPEGTRSPDGRLYRGKTGPIRLALRTGAPLIPVAMIGVFEVLPAGARIPKIRRVGIRIGRPLDLSRYWGGENDRFMLRSATDELMYELMILSGQEYVDQDATKVKAGEVRVGSGDLEELAGHIDDQPDMRKAS